MIEQLEQEDVDGVMRAGTAAIDFWMDDCPPCTMMDPKLRVASEEHQDVPVYRVNVKEGDALLERFDIEAMPAVLFFHDGDVVDRVEGLAHSGDLDAAFEALRRER